MNCLPRSDRFRVFLTFSSAHGARAVTNIATTALLLSIKLFPGIVPLFQLVDSLQLAAGSTFFRAINGAQHPLYGQSPQRLPAQARFARCFGYSAACSGVIHCSQQGSTARSRGPGAPAVSSKALGCQIRSLPSFRQKFLKDNLATIKTKIFMNYSTFLLTCIRELGT
jgi:hypothetical protein